MLLLVSLICATVGILRGGQTNPAAAASPTVVARDEPVRVVLPFIPNTPSQR